MNNPGPQRLIGESPALSDLLDQTSRLAALSRPVLVIGERGTGKELIAERLHYLSPRWQQPLVKINCGAVSESLLDTELFGYEPGAFTGAIRTHAGRFERAHEGTLFLDEVGTMSGALQEKLLRLIEYGEFERLGGQKTLSVDVRVVAATHENLPAMAERGEFRHDLLDRLAFDVLTLPPLRARPGDARLLAEQFGIRMSTELGWSMFPGFTDTALARLEAHPFYGNVRELKNAVERSVYRWGREDSPIDEVVLDPFASPFQPGGEPEEASPGSGEFTARVARFERRLLREALERHGHHQGKAAEALGLTYHQLRSQLRKHDLIGRARPKSH